MEEEDDEIVYEDEAVEVISLSDEGDEPLDGKYSEKERYRVLL